MPPAQRLSPPTEGDARWKLLEARAINPLLAMCVMLPPPPAEPVAQTPREMATPKEKPPPLGPATLDPEALQPRGSTDEGRAAAAGVLYLLMVQDERVAQRVVRRRFKGLN